MKNLVKTFIFTIIVTLISGAFGVAQATNVAVNLCFAYDINYTDTSYGDYYTVNSYNHTAYGVYAKIYNKISNDVYFLIWEGYTGAETGCVLMALNTDNTYAIKLIAQASLDDDNIIYVKNDHDSSPYIHSQWVTLSYSPPGEERRTFLYDFSLPYRTSNILAAVGYGLDKRPAGVSNSETTIWTEECPSGSGSCNSALYDEVFIAEEHRVKRFVISHEMGHRLFFLRNDEGAHTCNYDHTCNDTDCECSSKHCWHSREFASAATYEAWADFYSAAVWNDSSVDDDCRYQNHDCGLDRRYLKDSCPYVPLLYNAWLGMEGDWTNFLWDLHTKVGVSVGNILGIYIASSPGEWDEPYIYSDLRDAAITGYGISATQWDEHAEDNGIDYGH